MGSKNFLDNQADLINKRVDELETAKFKRDAKIKEQELARKRAVATRKVNKYFRGFSGRSFDNDIKTVNQYYGDKIKTVPKLKDVNTNGDAGLGKMLKKAFNTIIKSKEIF